MKSLQNTNQHSSASSRRPRFIGLVVVCLLMMSAFVLGVFSEHLVPSAIAASNTHAKASVSTASYPVKVFFSRYPESVSGYPSAVYSVDRTSPTIAVGTFSLQLLIAGPTLTEQQAGYFTELNTMLSGPSNCTGALPIGGPDFFLTLNKKGSVPELGTATVKFCRTINSPGIGADTRAQAEITATLKQFSNIKKVVILTKDGHCFGDQSGGDFCLR